MLRRFVTLILLLLLGALINAAVAWWCASRPAPNPTGRVTTTLSRGDYIYDRDPMHIIAWKRFGCISITDNRWNSFSTLSINVAGARSLSDDEWRGILPWRSAFRNGSPLDDTERSAFYFRSFLERSAGWPCYAFASTFLEMDSMNTGVENVRTTTGVMTIPHGWIPDSWTADVPTTPVWTGIAVNTAFYASGLWLIICGPFWCRRKMRQRRGRCPKCGYDLRGSATGVCPECGSEGRP